MFTGHTLSSTEHTANIHFDRSRPQNTAPPALSLSPRQRSPVSRLSELVDGDNTGVDSEAMSSLGSGQRPDLPPAPNPSKQYNQLPTPLSPNNFGHYLPSVLYTPGSPVPHSSQNSYPHLTSSSAGQRFDAQRATGEEGRLDAASLQTATPESSPFARTISRYTTPKYNRPPSSMESSMPNSKHTFSTLETPASSTLAPAHCISSPLTSPSEPRSSRLSSPFMAKLSIAEPASKSKTTIRSRPQSHTPEPSSTQVDIFFSPTIISSSNADPPTTSLPSSTSAPPISPCRPAAGGEMDRIRQSVMQDRLAHIQEAESRRPDYLKRAKRTLSEADPAALAEDERMSDRERESVVGILDSPTKGRRLKLFQETSEESFEESLMAGGYGRYRTADWVRQPQPILLASPGSAGPSNIISVLERAEEPPPPTEKEIKKHKRLAAFLERTRCDGPTTKLHPVELEGRGRVLLDIPTEGEDGSIVEGSPTKRKGGGRRKKKGELTAREKKALALAAAAAGDLPEKPNWPDAEFPWRLRTEERAEELKAEEAEKMKWIERFLDRDSDDEDEDERRVGRRKEEALQEHWTFGEEARPVRGRGKMVPLLENPGGPRSHLRKSAFFPSDPADARAALMSKKSVRTLSYRQQKRERQQAEDESDEEVLCICNGRDDGRELVQCDGCETWYHLQCIGIKDIAQLGKEEDPWFCHKCKSWRSHSSEPEFSSEPTFVPTDERPRVSPSYDAPFFQPSSLQDSPMAWDPPRMPRTPTRNRGAEYDPGSSSGSSWVESSRPRPSTPQHPPQGVRVYTHHTPGPFDNYSHPYDESPFDPTSTPSRGIRFGAPFATPKNNVWSSRANGPFQTPSKAPGGRSLVNKTFGGPGTLSSALDDSGGEHGGGSRYNRIYADDDSPIRRVGAGGAKARRIVDSPLALRSIISTSHLLEESPIMRYNDIERHHDLGHSYMP